MRGLKIVCRRANGGSFTGQWLPARSVPWARVKIFEGLGHNPFWEDPRAAAGAINEFLTGNAP